MNGSQRVIVVSNRLPITVEQVNGEVRVQPSCGGLVSALRPILQHPGATWVGWTGGSYAPGIAERIRASVKSNCALVPVFLTPAEKACFYDGCSNEVLWPLFHDLQSLCNFDPAYWDAYCQVTEKFADAVEQTAHRDDFIWVHDYHLIMLAEALHARELPLQLAYFHHIPFPSPDIFEKLPWRHDLLRCLLHFDSIGLQTSRDRVNFIASARRCLRDVEVKRVGDRLLVKAEGQATLVGTFPISIDFREFEQLAFDPAVAANAAAIQDNIRGEIILGVDRLDHTKGIPERLLAFRDLLEDHPELHGRMTLVQVVVPSREDIRSYQDLKLRIERLVSEINGQYATPAWTPLVYMHRCLSRQQLVAFYRAANVALVTPLKDGMNLVAKEFCAAHVDEAGVLVLSEFAGAAVELQCGALLVNPYDSRGVALALYRALRMSSREQELRMKRMRTWIQGHDVFHWAESVCGPMTGYRADHALDVTTGRIQPVSALKEISGRRLASSLVGPA